MVHRFLDAFIGEDPSSKHNARWLFALLAVYFFVAVLLVSMWMVAARAADPSLVRSIEMRVGVLPGQTKVLPECSCTVRYLGTRVRGDLYTIQIQKLD